MALTDEDWEREINEVLLKFGVIKEPFCDNAAKRLESVLQDYHDLAQEYSGLMTKYCCEAKPIKQNGVWVCPDCGRKTSYNHSYCHWCGKKIGWK